MDDHQLRDGARDMPYPDADSVPPHLIDTSVDPVFATGQPVLTPELAAAGEESDQTTLKALTSTNGRRLIDRKSVEPIEIATFEA